MKGTEFPYFYGFIILGKLVQLLVFRLYVQWKTRLNIGASILFLLCVSDFQNCLLESI